MALFGTHFPKENVFGETLQNCFLFFCLIWFVVVVLRFGWFCHFGLLGVFFAGWSGEGGILVFFVSRGYYCANIFFFL